MRRSSPSPTSSSCSAGKKICYGLGSCLVLGYVYPSPFQGREGLLLPRLLDADFTLTLQVLQAADGPPGSHCQLQHARVQRVLYRQDDLNIGAARVPEGWTGWQVAGDIGVVPCGWARRSAGKAEKGEPNR